MFLIIIFLQKLFLIIPYCKLNNFVSISKSLLSSLNSCLKFGHLIKMRLELPHSKNLRTEMIYL